MSKIPPNRRKGTLASLRHIARKLKLPKPAPTKPIATPKNPR